MKTNNHSTNPASPHEGDRPNQRSPRRARLRLISCLTLATAAIGAMNLSAQEAQEATEANTAAAETAPAAASTQTSGQANTDAAVFSGTKTDGVDLNFVNAPISQVLNYLSDAAGFIVQLDPRVQVRGNVSIRGKNLTQEEAYQLVNSELNKNNLAAVRKGRILRVSTKDDSKLATPVITASNPEEVPDNDELATYIIPIRFVEAQQLASDLSYFTSAQATIVPNTAGNSIVITDTQSNIRHLMEIIKAIDSSAEDVTEVKVFQLSHADPNEMATLLSGMFPDQNNAQTPFSFAGGRGGRGGRGGGGNAFAALLGGGGNSQNARIRKRNQVVAVADPRTRSVVVTATRDLMDEITKIVTDLDHEGLVQKIEVIKINNTDAQEILQVLQDTVGVSTSRNNRNQTSPFANRLQQSQNNNRTGGTFGTTGGRTGGGGGGGRGGF